MNPPTIRPLFNGIVYWIAAVGAVVSFFLPEDGLDITTCGMRRTFGVSCGGCGLTRSVTCISAGEIHKAWNFNPAGIVMWTVIFALALGVWPWWRRRALIPFLDRYEKAVTWAFWGWIAWMMVFGLTRIFAEGWWVV